MSSLRLDSCITTAVNYTVNNIKEEKCSQFSHMFFEKEVLYQSPSRGTLAPLTVNPLTSVIRILLLLQNA